MTVNKVMTLAGGGLGKPGKIDTEDIIVRYFLSMYGVVWYKHATVTLWFIGEQVHIIIPGKRPLVMRTQKIFSELTHPSGAWLLRKLDNDCE